MSPRVIASVTACFAALASLVVGCNAILGYDAATLESSESEGGAPTLSCTSYCSAIASACTGTNTEYLDTQVCMTMCEVFDPGIASDTTGDSLACRVAHLAAAKANPTTGCPQAGPTGAGACGSDPCQAFCELDLSLCSTQPTPPYPNQQTCQTDCDGFSYDAGLGDLTQSAGNTLNCRIYHLESAYDTDNPSAQSTHCPHTQVTSATCN
jgi:hypothetical protein